MSGNDELSGTRRLPRGDGPAADGGSPGTGAATAGATAGPDPTTDDAAAHSARYGRAGRFWSARRVPALIVALLLAAGSGLLLYDVAAVRADRPAMAWRRRIAEELATRRLDDVWVLCAAAVVLLIGLWLLVLALTPGLRAVLPMRRGSPDVRGGLDRSAAELVLRDRVMEVPGVQSVRMSVGRRTATARAVSHFRELDEVRRDLETALDDGLRRLGLARRMRRSVRVRRPKKR